MDNKKKIEIPFGAFDSELYYQEINIPDGFEATIKDNKIILERKDSKDERIRKELIAEVKHQIEYIPAPDCRDKEDEKTLKQLNSWLAWLEKQGEKRKITHEEICKSYDISDIGEFSDGYHTFNELYYYRMLYNTAFFNMLPKEWVHKSKKHHDGEECFGGGWFIVMANLPTGQISNHYELKYWDLFNIPEKEVADKWDGHTPQESAERLFRYLLEKQGEKKPKWTEEDESKLQNLIDMLSHFKEEQLCGYPVAIYLDWLKSLGNGVLPKPQRIISAEAKEALYDKPKWTEEDEKVFNNLIGGLIRISHRTFTDCTSPNYMFFEEVEWLKELKQRIGQ